MYPYLNSTLSNLKFIINITFARTKHIYTLLNTTWQKSQAQTSLVWESPVRVPSSSSSPLLSLSSSSIVSSHLTAPLLFCLRLETFLWLSPVGDEWYWRKKESYDPVSYRFDNKKNYVINETNITKHQYNINICLYIINLVLPPA